MSEASARALAVTRHAVRRLVEASDLDGYGVVHFARYAAFAETAALGLLEANGLGLVGLERRGVEVRVRDLRLRYRAAAAYADALRIEAAVTRPAIAHVVVAVRVVREDGPPGDDGAPAALVEGELDLVFVGAGSGRPLTLAEAVAAPVGPTS